MSVTTAPALPRPIHPLQAILLAFPLPLFLGALLSDFAYWRSYQMQWANFSSWLIAGGLLVGGFALLWALVDLVRRRGRGALFAGVLAAMWALGFVNALVHAKDAFAIMPEALFLSAVTTLLALAASWMAHARDAAGGAA